MNTDKITGGCTCGAVRYRLNAPPLFVHCCHCRWCQRETGTAFAQNAMIETAAMELTTGQANGDEVHVVEIPTNSGYGQWIARCPTCQVALWSTYGGAEGLVRYLRVGTLDQPEDFPPSAHIYVASKQPWVVLPEGVPTFESHYDASKVWPKESLDRYAVAAQQGG